MVIERPATRQEQRDTVLTLDNVLRVLRESDQQAACVQPDMPHRRLGIDLSSCLCPFEAVLIRLGASSPAVGFENYWITSDVESVCYTSPQWLHDAVVKIDNRYGKSRWRTMTNADVLKIVEEVMS